MIKKPDSALFRLLTAMYIHEKPRIPLDIFCNALLGIDPDIQNPSENDPEIRSGLETAINDLGDCLRDPVFQQIEKALQKEKKFKGDLFPIYDEDTQYRRQIGWRYEETNPEDPNNPKFVEFLYSDMTSYS